MKKKKEPERERETERGRQLDLAIKTHVLIVARTSRLPPVAFTNSHYHIQHNRVVLVLVLGDDNSSPFYPK